MLSADDYNSLSTPGNKSIVITYKNFNASVNFKLLAVYTVTFNANGGQIVGESSATVVEGKKLEALPQVNRDDYDLVGWQTADGKPFSLNTVITKDIEIKAIWDDIPNSEKATFTYYYLEDLEIVGVYKSQFINKDNLIYIPYEFNNVYNTATKEIHEVYYNINYLFEEIIEVGEEITEFLFIEVEGEKGFVIKTSFNNYYGFFANNIYGQYGLGHTDDIPMGYQQLFTEIPFNDGEEIINVYVNYTYNIAVTNQNRVFFTGSLGDIYPNYTTPEDVTNQFNLAADERFLSDMELAEIVSIYGSQAIYTNKRVFGLEGIFSSDSTGKKFIDLKNIFNNELLFILPNEEDTEFLIVTKDGKIESFTIDGDASEYEMEVPLNANETLVSCSFSGTDTGYFTFKTSNNRFIFFNFDDPDLTYTSDIIPNTVGSINNIYLFEDLLIIENTDGELYYINCEDIENIEDSITVYNFNEYLGLENAKIYINNFGFYHYMYILSDGLVYDFYDGELSKYNVIALKKRVESYRKGTEVVLEDYQLGDYRIDGWTIDFETSLEEKVIAEENLVIYPLLPEIQETSIHLLFDEFNDNLGYIYVIEGDKLSSEYIYQVLEEYFGSNNIIYGDISNYIFYDFHNDTVFDFDTPIINSTNLSVILDESSLLPVAIAYYSEDGEVIGYDQVYVANGGTIQDFYLDFNFDNKYRIKEYYLDYNELSYDPTTPITESLTITIVLENKVAYQLTIDFPEEFADLELIVYEGNEFLENEVYKAIDEINSKYNYKFNYTLEALYRDALYTKTFNPEMYIVNKDFVVYAKFVDSMDVLFKFYLDGEELKQYQRTQKLFLDEELNYIMPPYGYEIKGIYSDAERTNSINIYNDLENIILYFELEVDDDIQIEEVDFIFPQFDNFVYHYSAPYRSDKSDMLDEIIKQTTGISLYGWSLYSDSEFINPISEVFFEMYKTIYINLYENDEYNKITINYLNSDFDSIVYYLPVSYSLSSKSVINPLTKLMPNYTFSVNKVYTDATGNQEFDLDDANAYSNNLQLYVDFGTSTKSSLTVHILNGPIIEMYNDELSVELLIDDIEDYFRNIAFDDYDSELYHICLYEDEQYLNPVTTIGSGDVVLYGRIEQLDQVTITVTFINGDYQPFTIKHIKASFFMDYYIFNKLNEIYGMEYYEYNIYEDLEMETPLNSQVISEDMDFYVYLNRKIIIFFPQSFVPANALVIEDGGEINQSDIFYMVADYYGVYDYEIKLYTDIEMTIEYTGEQLAYGDYLFVDYWLK